MTRHLLRHEGARTTTVKCPECGDVIVYNGNFFCNSMDAIAYIPSIKDIVLDKGTCNWALPHPAIKKQDRAVCDRLGIDYA
jgi:hypothetical protein